MKIRSFLKLVEIQTKAASMVPFIFGTVFALYRYRQFDFWNFLFMLISLLSFDMTTTAINNYQDYKRAKKKKGFGYERHNAIVRDHLEEPTVRTVILVLLAVAVTFGILLYRRTSLIVLITGIVSFAVGILYTCGPVPISRMPLGECFSGFFMGFVIIFLSVWIQIPDETLAYLTFAGGLADLHVDFHELLRLFLVAWPANACIANIMLANNICDMEDDLENRRYTLPVYIGKERALTLFQGLYYSAFVSILLLWIPGILPWTVLPVLFTLIPVRRNIDAFRKLPTKKDTFVVAIQNFLLINVSLILLVAVGILL